MEQHHMMMQHQVSHRSNIAPDATRYLEAEGFYPDGMHSHHQSTKMQLMQNFMLPASSPQYPDSAQHRHPRMPSFAGKSMTSDAQPAHLQTSLMASDFQNLDYQAQQEEPIQQDIDFGSFGEPNMSHHTQLLFHDAVIGKHHQKTESLQIASQNKKQNLSEHFLRLSSQPQQPEHRF